MCVRFALYIERRVRRSKGRKEKSRSSAELKRRAGGWLTCPIGNVTPPPGSGPWCLVCEASTNYELRMPHGNWL